MIRSSNFLTQEVLDQNFENMELNERITEDIVNDILQDHKKTYDALYGKDMVKIEKQQSKNRIITKLLKHASKSGLGGGRPEFIITFNALSKLIIIVECKADIKKHESKNRDKPKDYAVDGVLHYSEYLAREFNVISLAISGQNHEELKISTFIQLLNQKYENKPNNQLMNFKSYEIMYNKNPKKERLAKEELMKYSRELNNKLRDEFELEEGERPLLVSGILIALENNAFESSYKKEKNAKDLAKSLSTTIKKVLEEHNIEQKRRDDMTIVYSFIESNINIAKDFEKERNMKLQNLIAEIDDKVRSYLRTYKFHDVIGQFYKEFLKYANISKGLGIVLTPHHITELFVDLAQVNKDSVILDNCCGTGGFLISAMKKMINDANNDNDKIQNIYKNQLIGIENNPKMFCLACSNMLLRGDGKSNIYHADCMNINNEKIKKLKPTIGFLNPPYSKKNEASKELNYVFNCLNFLEPNGTCIAIVPMSCATKENIIKKKILESHTLIGVLSMPLELFYPIGTTPCIMIFKAHIPHDANVESWFGYWRDDGFVKVKPDGRIDKDGKYEEIKKIWLDDFRNKKNVKGHCVSYKIKHDDEWCAEAYMKTDYSTITENDFKQTIKEFVLYKARNDC